MICNEAPTLQHTRSNVTAYHLQGAVVKYWCSGGYEAITGDSRRTCEVADKKPIWAGRDLQCSLSLSSSKWIWFAFHCKPRPGKIIHRFINWACTFEDYPLQTSCYDIVTPDSNVAADVSWLWTIHGTNKSETCDNAISSPLFRSNSCPLLGLD